MNPSSHRVLLLLGALSLFLLLAERAPAADNKNPQIVRVSYVQGDVRLSRGDGKHPDLQKPWEQAAVNVPIEQGFSLATGAGRAEIEFENGSTAYLAENSVLIFDQLESKDSLTLTLLSLVTGTATFSLHPSGGDAFVVKASAADVGFHHPTCVRVDSYLDGMDFTPQEEKGEDVQRVGLQKIHLAKGQTITYQNDQVVQLKGVDNSNTHADWDNWVLARVQTRKAAIEAGLKASGLSAPIPGLTDLVTQGTFFPCPPYGQCWQPAEFLEAEASPSQQTGGTGEHDQSVSTTPAPARQQAAPLQKGPEVTPQVRVRYQMRGMCPAFTERITYIVDPRDPRHEREIDRVVVQNEYWSWAGCHAGSWVHYRRHYAWVAGPKGRQPPVQRVCVKKRCGIIPVHPLDVQGKPPINLKYGIFLSSKKPGGHPTCWHPKPTDKVEVRSISPKEFSKTMLPQRTRVERPTIQAHFAGTGVMSAGGFGGKVREPMIRYDYKSQKFLQEGIPRAGEKTKPIVVGGLTHRGEFSGSLGGHSYSSGERVSSGSRWGGGSSNSMAGGGSTNPGASSGSHSSSGGSSAYDRGSSSGSHASGGHSSSSGSSSGGRSSGGGGGGSSSGSSSGGRSSGGGGGGSSSGSSSGEHSSGGGSSSSSSGGGGSSSSGSSSGSGSSGGSTGGGHPR